MNILNRIHNSRNPYQGKYKKVLCVCSAGLLRSPTTALVLSQEPYEYNTRAAGLNEDYALIPVDEVLLTWADEVVCMEPKQKEILEKMTNKPVVCLYIDDRYPYRAPELKILIKKNYDDYLRPNRKEAKPKKSKAKSSK